MSGLILWNEEVIPGTGDRWVYSPGDLRAGARISRLPRYKKDWPEGTVLAAWPTTECWQVLVQAAGRENRSERWPVAFVLGALPAAARPYVERAVRERVASNRHAITGMERRTASLVRDARLAGIDPEPRLRDGATPPSRVDVG